MNKSFREIEKEIIFGLLRRQFSVDIQSASKRQSDICAKNKRRPDREERARKKKGLKLGSLEKTISSGDQYPKTLHSS